MNQQEQDKKLIEHVMYKDMGDLCAVFDYGGKNVKRFTIQDILAAQGRLEYQRGVELMRDYALAVLETVHLDKGLNDWKATKTLSVAKKAIETLPTITFTKQ